MSGGRTVSRAEDSGRPLPGAAVTRDLYLISTVDGFILSFEGRRVPLVNRKAQALLVYLAMRQAGSEGRERLAGLLWSEADEHKARASLRQSIADLKHALAPFDADILAADRSILQIDLDRVRVDVFTLLEELEAGSVPRPLLEHKGLTDAFLAGFEDLDPAFRSWLLVQRQFLHERFLRGLEEIIRANRGTDMLRRCGTAIVNLDPTHEVGCRALIKAHARDGDMAAALKVYRELWQLLEEEFDTEPSEATQELIVALKTGQLGADGARPDAPATVMRGAARPAQDAGPSPGADGRRPPHGATPEPMLVMLVGEFDATNVSPQRSALVKIFRHQLVASLVRFRDWTVIEASAPAALSHSRPIYEVQGAALEEDENRLEFVLTLKEIASGRYLWSETLTVEAASWQQVHQKIIRRLSGSLGVNLTEQRLNQIGGASELSLPLYDRWLKGQSLCFTWRPADEDEAEEIFRSIIAEAPGFAPAYSSLVGILNSRHLVYPGIFRIASRHEDALELAKSAVQLDAMDSRAHLSLAWSFVMSGIFDRGAAAFELACDLNGNDPWTLASSALGLAYCGYLDGASSTADNALDVGLGLSALHWAYQASVRFILEDYEGAVEAAAKADDAVLYLGGWTAAAHALAGRQAEAEEEARRFAELIGSHWFGDDDPTAPAVAAWFLHCFPISSERTWSNLRYGLDKAGLQPPETSRFSPRPPSSPASADRVVRYS